MRRAFEFRAPINVALAGMIGVVGLYRFPFPSDNAFLAAIDPRKPWLFDSLAYVYATLWFSTPIIVLSVTTALLYVAVMRLEKVRYVRTQTPASAWKPCLVVGEQHHATNPVLISQPAWLRSEAWDAACRPSTS